MTKRWFKDQNGEEFNILEARDGKEGLRISLKEQPDLILLDIVMPIMDGMTMLRKLRKDKWGETAQIILLTNLTSVERKAETIEQNVSDYLIKSDWKIDNLIEIIKSKLL